MNLKQAKRLRREAPEFRHREYLWNQRTDQCRLDPECGRAKYHALKKEYRK